MKTEIREVTVKREIFIAEDGKEFEDHDDCKCHEIKLLEKTLKCYDGDYSDSNVESCTFVDLQTESDVEHFLTVCNYFGINDLGVDKPGLYMFDDTYRNSSWVNLDEVISSIRGRDKTYDQTDETTNMPNSDKTCIITLNYDAAANTTTFKCSACGTVHEYNGHIRYHARFDTGRCPDCGARISNEGLLYGEGERK